MRKRFKRVLRLFIYLMLFLVLIVALLPAWLPWILNPIAAHFGATYSSYQRLGYTHLRLRDVHYERRGIQFDAKQLDALVPTLWLWKKLLPPSDQKPVFVSALDWHLIKVATTNKSSFHSSLGKSEHNLAHVKEWIPKATLLNGRIVWKGEEVFAPSMDWNNGLLSGNIFSTRLQQSAALRADFSKRLPWKIMAAFKASRTRLEFTLDRSSQEGHISGFIIWHTARADFSAAFVPGEKLPESAHLEAPSFLIRAEDLRLSNYRGLAGSLSASWKNGRLKFDLTANAQPLEHARSLPPVSAEVHATGDTNSLHIEAATFSAPWLRAELSRGFEMSFTGRLISDDAIFRLSADLNKQPWLPISGQLDGEVSLRRASNRYPDVSVALSGQALKGFRLNAQQLSLQGGLAWPALTLKSFVILLNDGSRADAKGSINLQTRSIEAAHIDVAGTFATNFLPPTVSWKALALAADLSGPLTKPRHDVQVRVEDLSLPELKPLDVNAKWHGNFLEIEHFDAQITPPGKSQLSIAGTATITTNTAEVLLRKLDLKLATDTFSLQSPTKLLVRKSAPPVIQTAQRPASQPQSFLISLQFFHWRSGEREINGDAEIAWPHSGKFSILAQSVSPTLLQDYFRKSFPLVFIDKFNSAGGWNNGPATFSLSLATHFSPEKAPAPNTSTPPFLAQIEATGNEKGLTISKLLLADKSGAVFSGTGTLPLTFDPRRERNLLQLQTTQPMQFHGETLANPTFWNELARRANLVMQEPHANISIAGTLNEPRGTVALNFASAELKPATNLPPVTLQKFSANLNLTRHQIDLTDFRLLLEGQAVHASGTFPLPEQLNGDWKKILDWKRATGQLQMENIQVSSLAKFSKNVLSPQGIMNVNVTLRSGGKLSGELTLVQGATRPFAQMGALQDVDALLRLNGNEIRIVRCTGLLGGGPVAAFGRANLFERDPATKLPRFEITLRGDNVPLARRPDLILRSGFDLHASNLKGGIPVITGTANLQNSYYLSDLRLLVPGRVARPKNRPPYFSVEAKPFADWRLDVHVYGNEFLKVRSPFFTGTGSANFRLSGNLREPQALGDLKINSGSLQFPFANLQVGQGDVSLTSANPYLPHLFVTASARAFDYDIKLQVTGPADNPHLEFSSTPGLSSEQILLMLTTGELPATSTSFSMQQRASRLGLFVGKNILSRFGVSGGASERLTIRSGESFAEQGRETYSVEYKLNDDWSVVGDYDRFGGINVGLRWRFFSE